MMLSVSGKAIEAAREDYRNISRARQMQAVLPKAWAKLVEEEDDLLLELVADRVESLCGYKPDPDTVARFLKEKVTLKSSTAGPPQQSPGSPRKPIVPRGGPTPLSTAIGIVLDGQHFPARNARDVLVTVFEMLTNRDATFLDRFAALPKHGRSRRYLARNPKDLYPGRPDLSRDHSVQLSSGWWLGTNLSRAAIDRIIKMACEVARLVYGRDILINLGE